MERELRLQHADNMRTNSKLRTSWLPRASLALLLASLEVSRVHGGAAESQTPLGYYRFQAIYGDTVVFTAEGDLWRVSVQGGMAQRLTSHLGTESHAAFSPDG
jgi:tricorn protease